MYIKKKCFYTLFYVLSLFFIRFVLITLKYKFFVSAALIDLYSDSSFSVKHVFSNGWIYLRVSENKCSEEV